MIDVLPGAPDTSSFIDPKPNLDRSVPLMYRERECLTICRYCGKDNGQGDLIVAEPAKVRIVLSNDFDAKSVFDCYRYIAAMIVIR
jgi:hypothetical protein